MLRSMTDEQVTAELDQLVERARKLMSRLRNTVDNEHEAEVATVKNLDRALHSLRKANKRWKDAKGG
jgi:hypothetical protein